MKPRHYLRLPDGTRVETEPCDLEPIMIGLPEMIAAIESALKEKK